MKSSSNDLHPREWEELLNNLSEGICLLDISGNILKYNHSFLHLLNIDLKDEVTGKSLYTINKDLELNHSLESLLDKKTDIEVDGRWLSFTLVPFEGNRYILKVSNITDLKEASLEVERSNREVEQFVYIVSHDLREPLRMVLKFSELMIKKFQKGIVGNVDEYFGFISEGIQRMQNITSDLLSYSRLTQSAKEFSIVDLNEVLHEALNALAIPVKDTVAKIAAANLPSVYGNRGTLIELFRCLIENSMKFHQQAVAPVIEITAEESPKFWTITIKDNGIGIDPKFNVKIFQIFQRLHSQKKYVGTGTGLAMSKRIVELHGGDIWVNSTPGAGAAFLFTLTKVKEPK